MSRSFSPSLFSHRFKPTRYSLVTPRVYDLYVFVIEPNLGLLTFPVDDDDDENDVVTGLQLWRKIQRRDLVRKLLLGNKLPPGDLVLYFLTCFASSGSTLRTLQGINGRVAAGAGRKTRLELAAPEQSYNLTRCAVDFLSRVRPGLFARTTSLRTVLSPAADRGWEY